jgi:hypothetical protein
MLREVWPKHGSGVFVPVGYRNLSVLVRRLIPFQYHTARTGLTQSTAA